jgi:isopropylmalate/homocitrate/citramalate synthase
MEKRTGNCNLTNVIPTIAPQAEQDLGASQLAGHAKYLSQFVDEIREHPHNPRHPGSGTAFSHKGART